MLEVFFPVFAIMAVGAMAVWSKVLKREDSAVLNRYNLYFAFPALMFQSLAKVSFANLMDGGFVFLNLLALVLTLLTLVLVGQWFGFSKRFLGIAAVAGTFGNVAYMGLPILSIAYGEKVAAYAPLQCGLTIVFCLVVGVAVMEAMSGKATDVAKLWKGVLLNPLVLSILAGLLASLLKWELSVALSKSVGMLAATAGPSALFAIGMFLVRKRQDQQLNWPKVWWIIIGNMVFLPGWTLVLLWIFGNKGLSAQVSMLQASMPLAATCFVIAEQGDNHQAEVAQAIVLSTMISIISLPLTLFFLV